MMRKNNLQDFSIPTRQSTAAIIIIMIRFFKLMLRQFFPIFILIFINGKWAKTWGILIAFSVLIFFGIIYSIVAFFRHRYFIKDSKLIVTKGVFKKTRLEIPLDRIQSVNFQQGIIHQLFDVVKLEMDTAGSAKNEMELYALEEERAQQLSEIILSHKKATSKKDREINTSTQERKRVFTLSLFQLFKVGITENHIRSGGVILFFFIWLFDNLRELGLDMYGRMEEYAPDAEQVSQNLFIVFMLIALIVIVSLIISMVRTVLKYFDLNMFRLADGFVVKSGLLNKKEYAAKDRKIQMMEWSQNLLQSMAKIYELTMKQASSVQVSDKRALKVVGLSKPDIEQTAAYIFKKLKQEIDRLVPKKVNGYYLLRRILIAAYIFAPGMIATLYLGITPVTIILTSLLLFIYFASLLKYYKKKYAVGENVVVVEGGTFGRRREFAEVYKAQAVEITTTPFQRRRKLATLHLINASGAIIIPEIPFDEALQLRDRILYKVESTKKSWM
ncbi:MAG: PH domain-containing protein [Saprospiraceae bacterium]|nr:PH domain-containing protein [Saprospiraceae bacterium]